MSSYFENMTGAGADDDADDKEELIGGDSDEEEDELDEADDEEVNIEDGEDANDDNDLDPNDPDSDSDSDDQEGGAKDDLEDGEIEEIEENDDQIVNDDEVEKKAKRTKKVPAKTVYKKALLSDNDFDDDDDDDDGENYLQKFDKSINENYIVNYHPECVLQNYDEILSMVKVLRNSDGIIIDDLHKTIPYLTKYERARILGQRAKQINSGSTPFIKVPESVIDGYNIAEMELKEKRIPFIIRRPLPNGGSEYWSLKDLEDISF